MNSYTLWRGDTLLGHFTEQQPVTRHGARVGAAGLLESTDAFAGFAPMMQTRVRLFPGAPIFQSPMPVIDFNRAGERRPEASGPVPIREMRADEARGVPVEEVLVIRNGSGNVVDADVVSVWCTVFPTDVDLAEISRSFGVAIDSREVWQVSFTNHDTIAT
jgi:hypothetical protein